MINQPINFTLSDIESKRLFTTLAAIALTAGKMDPEMLKVFIVVALRISYRQFGLEIDDLKALVFRLKDEVKTWDDANRLPANQQPAAPIQ